MSILFLYEYEISHVKDVSFIINDGDMNITNMSIDKTISHIFIANLGSLYAEFVSFSPSFSRSYLANNLHSTRILMQSGTDSFIKLTQPYFVGSHYILTLFGGGAAVTVSVFEKNNAIIETTAAANSILIKNCTFSNMEWVLSKRLFVSIWPPVNKKYFINISYNYLYVKL